MLMMLHLAYRCWFLSLHDIYFDGPHAVYSFLGLHAVRPACCSDFFRSFGAVVVLELFVVVDLGAILLCLIWIYLSNELRVLVDQL